MPIGILKFKLPEDREEFEQAQLAGQYKSAIDDFRNLLRLQYKHIEMTELEHCKVCEIREKFFEIFEGCF